MSCIYVMPLTGAGLDFHFSLQAFCSGNIWNNNNSEEEMKDNIIQEGLF